jgi:hypothetical protein
MIFFILVQVRKQQEKGAREMFLLWLCSLHDDWSVPSFPLFQYRDVPAKKKWNDQKKEVKGLTAPAQLSDLVLIKLFLTTGFMQLYQSILS